MADGLLSPDDMMVYGADGLKPTTPPERYFRHPILPIGWDWDKPPSERQKELAMPMIFAEPAKIGKGLMDYFTGTMTDGMGYYDTYPTYDYEPSPQERFENAGVNFALDFGLLPAVGGAVVRPAPKNALRMGAGGGETKNIRSVDDLGFYSEALEQAKLLPMNSGTGEQFRSMLIKRGVKPDEIKFTPKLEGLLAQPRVTKDELVGLLEESRIRPQETVYAAGDAPQFEEMNFPTYADQLDIIEAHGRDYLDEMAGYDLQEIPDELLDDVVTSNPRKYSDEEISEARKIIEEGRPTDEIEGNLYTDMVEAAERRAISFYEDNPTYRMTDPDTGYEIIGDEWDGYDILDPEGNSILPELTRVTSLPEATIQAENHAMDAGVIGSSRGGTQFAQHTESGGTNYREMLLQVPEYEGMQNEFFATGHFDEPNIVVHARTKDRNSETGVNDVLYVEELQSDWGQRGRNLGFDTPENKAKMEEIQKRGKALEQAYGKAADERDQLIEGFANRVAKDIEDDAFFDPSMGNIYAADGSRLAGWNDIRRYLEHGRPLEVLTTDFSKGFRKIIQPDEQLSKKYNELTRKWQDATQEYRDQADEYRGFKAEIPVAPLVTNTKKFAEVGIKRLINQAVKEGKRYVSFTTGDLQAQRWNNSGLRTYYDDIIPKVAKTVVKRLDKDAKTDFMFVEDVADMGGNSGQTRFTIEITPAMREAVMGGQPLFSTPTIPLSGIFAEDNDNQQQGLLGK